MGALASIDALGIGSALELATADGQRAIATGVEAQSVQQSLGVYTPEQFGAGGQGVTDDLDALQRFETARRAGNGLGLLRGAYGVSAPFVVSDGIRWVGYGTIAGKSRIVALGSMEAPVIVQNPGGVVVPNQFANLRFDAARLAKGGFISQGNAGVRFSNCTFANGLWWCERSANIAQPSVLSAVTQTGPGPALSVSLLDPTFCQPFAAHMFLKVFTTGDDGVGAIGYSADGVTYFGTRQVLFADNQIGFPGGPDTFITSTGIGLHKAAGALQSGTVYDFTITEVPAINNGMLLDHCDAEGGAAVFATAGLAGSYPGPSFNTTTVAGTVSTTAGDPLLRFTGASLLALVLQDGDAIRIPGLTVTRPDGTTAQQRLKVVCCLNDNRVVVDWTSAPNQTLTDVGFAISRGAAFWEDTATGNQSDRCFIQPRVTTSAMCFRVGGLSGSSFENPIYSNWAISAFSVGTPFAD